MKYVFLILFSVFTIIGVFGYIKHKDLEISIKDSVQNKIFENGKRSVFVKGIHLPITLTFLSQKVKGEIILSGRKLDQKGNKIFSIKVDVTPIENLPIISIFSNLEIYTEIPLSELRNLKKYR